MAINKTSNEYLERLRKLGRQAVSSYRNYYRYRTDQTVHSISYIGGKRHD